MQRVYLFAEGFKCMIYLLGGKGGNLAEMQSIGLPIPEGIIISTEACKEYYGNGELLSEELKNEVLEQINKLEELTGKKFEGEQPLLVSVRSGAPVSMPGMMDTILNLGMNDKTAENMIRVFNNENFVYDLYFRFIQMFSEIVMGVEKEKFFTLKENLKNISNGELIKEAKKLYNIETGKIFPESAREQLFMAINSIFKSWENERAKVYRRINRIDDSMGTAVVVQEMVFGNLNEKSGTGVAFTRNPSNGEKEIFGEYLLRAQGEDMQLEK